MVELTMPDLAAAMRAAVRGLVDRLNTEQRRQLVLRELSLTFSWTKTTGTVPPFPQR